MSSRLLAFSSFPCRPKRHGQESLVGYIYRFLAANGHRIAVGGYYNAVCHIYAKDLERSASLLRELAVTIGEPDYSEAQFWRQREYLFKDEFYRTNNKFPKQRSKHVWFCCTCMKEEPIHREYWVFPLAKTCPVHNESLSSVCRVCEKPLSWSGLNGGWRCSAGHKVYDGVSSTGTLRSVIRDQFFSLHSHFFMGGVPSNLARYREQVAIHEVYVAYLSSLTWNSPTAARSVVDLDWGLESYANAALNVEDEPNTMQIEYAIGINPPVTFLFIRWLYLWRIVMQPAGCHIPEYVSTLAHMVVPGSFEASGTRRKSAAERKFKKTAELIYPHRVARLSRVLIHVHSQVPLNIGVSALRQFDQWWPQAVDEAHQGGYASATWTLAPTKDLLSADEETDAAVDREVCLANLINLLVFAACMDFRISDLNDFWSGIGLPRRLPGRPRQRPYKRLIAHLMRCSMAELQHWKALLEASLHAQRRRFCEHLR
ncbi:hypothetical protein CR159_18645 [Pollutimonas subterranea]|uniref:TniQ domain-containing protein n=1 Tax=Pollutimonas subterranea TaxID=2045210 RepID=A0A2N4TZY1_9BURK|nr:TniQ family protein [Pollutimonas subterranea]PLC48311.1 hypothetical protein CR159_18645 [Pollutimonas subterranea]